MNEYIYLIGKWLDSGSWEVLGAFDSEEVAVKNCTDSETFMMPVKKNFKLDSEIIEVGHYPLGIKGPIVNVD